MRDAERNRLISFLAVLLVWHGIAPAGYIHAASTNGPAEEEFAEFDDEFDADFDIADQPQAHDPLRSYNRFMFNVNDRLYSWILKPVGKAYGKIIPEQVRLSVQRCAKNLMFPARFVNSGLQGKFREARIELGRFTINSTVGIVGLFDPADSLFDLKPSEEDFGQTLGRYGVGEGFPLVLPLLGQSNLRDALGMLPDYFLHPISYVEPPRLSAGIRAYEKENYVSLHIGEYEMLKDAALDPYTMIRDGYRQKRQAEIGE